MDDLKLQNIITAVFVVACLVGLVGFVWVIWDSNNYNYVASTGIELTGPTLLESSTVATTKPIDLKKPVSSIDGIQLRHGDSVLVKDQIDKTENGVYILFNDFLVRRNDLNQPEETTNVSVVVLLGYTNADSLWRQDNKYAIVGEDKLFFKKVEPDDMCLLKEGRLYTFDSGRQVCIKDAGILYDSDDEN